MGWWNEQCKGMNIIIGDDPVDVAGQMFDCIAAAYEADLHRKPSLEEVDAVLKQALSPRLEDVVGGAVDVEVHDVSIKLRKRPNKQPIRVGDYFSVPLPSGGFGFGRIEGIYVKGLLFVEFLEAYSEQLLSIRELVAKPALFMALCGYLGLANWDWKVLGNRPISEHDTHLTEKEEAEQLIRQFRRVLAPYGGALLMLEDALRDRGILTHEV